MTATFGGVFERSLHEPPRDAATSIGWRDGHIGNLPTAAELVSSLDRDVAHDFAGLDPDIAAQHIVEFACTPVDKTEKPTKMAHEAHFTQGRIAALIQLVGKCNRNQFCYRP